MKKIKLLLLGIVSILGIGCSFGTYWQNDVDYNIGFYVKNLDFISNYGFGSFSVNSNNDGLSFNLGNNYYYSNCSHPNNCSESEIFSINSVGNGTPSVFRYGKFYYGSGFYSIYTFNGSSGTIFNMLNSSNYSISQAISPTDGNFSNSIDYYYTRLFLDPSNVSQDGFANWLASGSSRGGVTAEKYQIFSSSFASQVIRSDGLKYDCLVLNGQNIEECYKIFISAGFTDGYSFVISDDSEFRFRSVLNGFADSYSYYISSGQNQYQSGYTLDGVYIMKLNNFGVINTGNYIMSMALDGDSLNFSLYDCPNNSLSINNCLFVKGGTITSDFSSSDFRSFIYAPTFHNAGGFRGNSFHIVNYYNPVNGKLYLYRGTSYMGYLEYDFDGFSSITLDLLQSSENPNILNNFIEYSPDDSGNGNQSFPDPIFDGGVFDANTFLIEESIKCYLTSGEVCNSPFTYESSVNYVNNYDHQERVRNSADKTGYLTFNNSVDMLSQYCLNVNTIQYAFCSQLYLYEGYPITYYYNNGYFNYIISGSGWQVNLGSLWSGQLGYAYCEGPFCSNFNEGLPQFIRKDTGDYSEFGFSGEYISLDFFKNYFENGFFFQCPFSYSGSYFTIGSKLIDRLDKHDPLKPINCMIAGFSHGIKTSFFGDSKLGLSHSGVLMNNTGPNATRFYTFLDIVLSLGYIFLFSKLFKFLKKH